MKMILALISCIVLSLTAGAALKDVPIDNLEGTILIGQLSFNGTGNYSLELDSPQLNQPQLINLINLTPGYKYQITFTAREYRNTSPTTR